MSVIYKYQLRYLKKGIGKENSKFSWFYICKFYNRYTLLLLLIIGKLVRQVMT